MRPKPRKTLTFLAVGLAVVAGCTLNRSAPNQNGETLREQLGGVARIIEPKRCLVTVMILPRPLGDKVINEAVWSAADEQAVPLESRRQLEANGLRAGVITGSLPTEVEHALNAPPPDRVAPAEFNQPDGMPALISLAESTPTVNLLLSRDGRAFGKDYHDASGMFRVTPTQEGPTGVALRFVPEIHHGPVTRRYDAMPNSDGVAHPMQFLSKDGQEEESLRELAVTLTLQPGQVAVLGCNPNRKGSVGAFLFTRPDANTDRLTQKIVLVRSTRTHLGAPGSQLSARPGLVPEEPPPLPIATRRKGPADTLPPSSEPNKDSSTQKARDQDKPRDGNKDDQVKRASS